MTTPVCYKCGTTQELSLKKSAIRGNAKYICKTCRRIDYDKNKERIKLTRMSREPINKEWVKWAKEKNSNLVQRRADHTLLTIRETL